MSSSRCAATHLSSPHTKLLLGPQPTTVRGAALHLGKHPKEPTKVIYPSGKYVIVRDLDNPTDFFVYRGHNAAVTVAKFSPSGFWVASGDASGKVRVWSWDNPEHVLKLETQVMGGGEVKDLDWDPESKRLVAVGEGQGTNAKVFLWDTGNSLGELNGHGKRVISAAYRPCRPFRLVTASEDTRTVHYTGPPFVLDHSNTEHNNWVNTVRYSPNGKVFATASSDKRVLLYDGTTGEMQGELQGAPEAHAGSIYSLAFSPDSSRLATASADKTVKVWNVASKALEATFPFAPEEEIGEMQNAVLWVGADSLVSVSLNGDMNLLDVGSGDNAALTKRKALHGHQVTITALAVDREHGAFYTASYDGVVCAWDKTTGTAQRLGGPVPRTTNLANHAGKITGLAVIKGGQQLRSVGFDDKLRTADLDETGGGRYGTHDELSLPGQPVAIAAAGGASELVAVVHFPKGLLVYRGAEVVASVDTLPCVPASVAVFGEDEVAVGGEDNKVYVYTIGGGGALAAAAAAVLEGPRGQISALAYSPGGEYLAVGDSNREVSVFARSVGDGGGWTSKVSGQWVHHTSRVMALAWSPSGQYVASGALDSHIMVWSVEGGPRSRVATLDMAHKDGVTVLEWLGEGELVSSGNDAVVVVWDVAAAILSSTLSMSSSGSARMLSSSLR